MNSAKLALNISQGKETFKPLHLVFSSLSVEPIQFKKSIPRREALKKIGMFGALVLSGVVVSKTDLIAMAGKGDDQKAIVKSSSPITSVSELNGSYQGGNPNLVLQRGNQDAYYDFDATEALKAVGLNSIPERSHLYQFLSPDGNLLRFLLLMPGAHGSIGASVRLDASGKVGCRFFPCKCDTSITLTAEKSSVIEFKDKAGLVILTGTWISVLTANIGVSFDLTKFLKENGLDSISPTQVDATQPDYVVISIPGKDGKIHSYGISRSDGNLYAGA